MPDTNMPFFAHMTGVQLRRLGPAIVTGIAGSHLEVQVEERHILAVLAVPGFYTPIAGDSVLLIEAGEQAYVIGVLQARGPSTITAPGDLRILAPNGHLSIAAAAISANAPQMRLNAETLWLTAGQLSETFRNVRRLVSDLLEIDAGTLLTRVAETFSLKARRVQALAQEDVKIDGTQIHLG
ncbi:MAG TPA: DUF3540 domain-containing protein [Acidocella sp.]|nr:DUF3540 domain-containing protein [Acidocella sp.]HQU03255.1 DUF3540 domain-containing protein [Acidocella sp.]